MRAASDVLLAAGVEHVFLRGVDDSARDSDVDVLIAREGLEAADSALRSGLLGRLVQRVEYDIPWCRCYVVDTRDPRRRFRQLDLACDPYGISQCGPVLEVALGYVIVQDGIRMLAPGMNAVYLACKRAVKELRDADDLLQLRRAVAADPAAAALLLEMVFGKPGREFALAVAEGQDMRRLLVDLRRSIAGRRRRPAKLVVSTAFRGARLVRRVTRPTGLVVGLAGPDGSGKSTLAENIAVATAGLFRRSERRHLGPGLLPAPGRLLKRTPPDSSRPHCRAPSGRAGSLLRISWLAADAFFGWWPRILVPKIRSGLVLLERGWTDLLVDPRRYRLGSGDRLARLLSRALPSPDVTLVLDDEPSRIHARKPELGLEELTRQLRAWDSYVVGDRRMARLPVADAEQTTSAALDIICERLSQRAGDLSSFPGAVACLGPSKADARRYSLISAGGRPRWIVPRGIGAPGPSRVSLYRPASVLHMFGALMIEARQRLGGVMWPVLELDEGESLAPEIAAALGREHVELAALLPTDRNRGWRTVLSVLELGRTIAFAKVEQAGSPELGRELQVLSTLETAPLKTLVPPRPLAFFPWRGLDVLVVTSLPIRGRTDRAPERDEESALIELATLRDHLGPALDGDGIVPVHGDFCAWNSSPLHGSRLAVWDWEWAHMGEPLEDWFHWQTQRLIHFGHGSVDELVRSALEPTARLRDLCARLSFDPAAAPRGLRASLRHALATLSVEARGPGRTVREEALVLLEAEL